MLIGIALFTVQCRVQYHLLLRMCSSLKFCQIRSYSEMKNMAQMLASKIRIMTYEHAKYLLCTKYMHAFPVTVTVQHVCMYMATQQMLTYEYIKFLCSS
jgi:hypothetical protein